MLYTAVNAGIESPAISPQNTIKLSSFNTKDIFRTAKETRIYSIIFILLRLDSSSNNKQAFMLNSILLLSATQLVYLLFIYIITTLSPIPKPSVLFSEQTQNNILNSPKQGLFQ